MKTRRSGPSERFQAALDDVGYPGIREGRAQYLCDEFEMSPSSVQRMLTGDHVPSRKGLKSKIVNRLNISAAYWEFGVDPYTEDLVCSQRDLAWTGLMHRLQELGYDVGSIPVGLLEQLVRLVYRTAVIGEGEIDMEELNRVVEMSSFMLKQPPPEHANADTQDT